MKIWADENFENSKIHPLDNWKKLVEKKKIETILPKRKKLKKIKNSHHTLNKVLFSIIEKKRKEKRRN